MSASTLARFGATVFLSSLASSATADQQGRPPFAEQREWGPLVANDSVTLPAAPDSLPLARSHKLDESTVSDQAPSVMEAPMVQASVATEAPESKPSASESKPLGRAQALQKAGGKGAQSNKGSFLERFDPRNHEISRVLGALAIVIGLLLLMRTVARRASGRLSGGNRPSGVVEILARYPVARGQQFILLKLARRIILLHQAGSSMSPLSEITDPTEVASLLSRMEAGSTERSAAKFRSTLNEFVAEQDARPVYGPARRTANTLPMPAGVAIGDSLRTGSPEIIDLTRKRPRRGLLGGRPEIVR